MDVWFWPWHSAEAHSALCLLLACKQQEDWVSADSGDWHNHAGRAAYGRKHKDACFASLCSQALQSVYASICAVLHPPASILHICRLWEQQRSLAIFNSLLLRPISFVLTPCVPSTQLITTQRAERTLLPLCTATAALPEHALAAAVHPLAAPHCMPPPQGLHH